MLEALRDVNVTLEIKSIFLHILHDWSVALSHFSGFSFLFYSVVVIMVPDLCPHGTSPMYSG